MKKKVRAIFINAEKKEITEVMVEKGSFKDHYALIGNKCDLVQVVPFKVGKGDTLLVDEEGLCKEVRAQFFFQGWGGPLQGNAIVDGGNGAESTIEEIKERVAWL